MDRKPEEAQRLDAPAADGGEGSGAPRRISRRRLLGYAAGGIAGAAAAGYALSPAVEWFLGGAERGGHGGGVARLGDAPSAEVFRGGAPDADVWRLWRKRRWAREAMHWRRLGRNVRCLLCPNNCLLAPGDRGRCRNRVNIDGTLYTMVYGNPCSFHVDPIEKKPLFHFLPASGVFSVATSGCGFRCLNCQNWEISQRKPEETKDANGPAIRATLERLRAGLTRAEARRLSMFPEDVIDLARATRCPSIAYTYSEPTCFYEYMIDTAKLARAKSIKSVWVTCGYVHREPLERLCDVLDAANVDLKSFDETMYRTLNSGRLEPVLDTLKTLKRRGVWLEVTNLIVPTHTDSPEMIAEMCRWIVGELGPDVPIHFSRFHPQHKLTHLPPTPREVLVEARRIAREVGLRYVYVGNLRGVDGGETTYCPSCRRPVIERYGYALREMHLEDGRCDACGAAVAGVWG